MVIALLLTSCTSNQLPEPDVAATSPTTTSDRPAREQRWDPRDVDDLPHAAKDVASALPAVVDPPADVPLLEASPMDAAVLSVDRRGGRIQLLGVDGSWREVRLPSPHGRMALSRAELSPDGTRLAALLDHGIEVWHLPTGDRTSLPLPSGYRPWDYSWIGWVDDDALLLDDLKGGWRVDAITGAVDEVPYPTGMSFGWNVDDRGAVVEVSDPAVRDVLTDWGGGVRRRIDMSPTGRLSSIRARDDTVVGTSFDHSGHFGVYVADRADLTPLNMLPVRDHEANYSNWGLRTVGILDDGSVLLWVAVPSRKSEVDGWRIVRWVPETDRVEVVTTSESDPTWPLTFARDVLVPPTPPWNPRGADDLPAAAADVASLLPAVLDVPQSSPSLAGHSIDAAVLTVGGDDGDVHLLAVDGSWRSVPPGAGTVELTRDGTRLAVQTESGVDVWDLATGTRTSIAYPAGYLPMEDVTWHWLDSRSLLLDGSWRVDAETGDASPVRAHQAPFVVDDAGEVYEYEWGSELTLLQVRGDTVAGVGWSVAEDSLAVAVADRADLTPRHVLPVQDDGQTTYGNGGLSVQALLDDGTVLLRVLIYDHGAASVRFVAWDPSTEDLSLVTRTPGVLPSWSVAADLLG